MAVDWKKLIGLKGPDPTAGSTGLGPDWPESAGDREKGKFRPSQYPRLVQVAVVNDNGTQIGSALVPSNEEMAYWLKAMYAGLISRGIADDVTDGLVFQDL